MSYHRKCLTVLGPQDRLRDYDSVCLPILFTFLINGPGDSFIPYATPATVDRTLIRHWWQEATLISLSASTQLAAACTYKLVISTNLPAKPQAFLVPSSGLVLCSFLFLSQWSMVTLCQGTCPSDCCPRGPSSLVCIPRQQEAMGCCMWMLENRSPYWFPFSRNQQKSQV